MATNATNAATPASATTAPLNTKVLNELIEQTKHYDADERFMAMHDLVQMVSQYEGNFPDVVQTQLCQLMLRVVDDKNSDVSTVAVKCLNQLSLRISTANATLLATKLGDSIAMDAKSLATLQNSSNSQDSEYSGSNVGDANREVLREALHTILSSSPIESGRLFAPKISETLASGLEDALKHSTDTNEIDREMSCLSVLKDVLERYGNDIVDSHEKIMNVLLHLLTTSDEAIRDRVAATLAPFSVVLSDKLYATLMASLIRSLSNPNEAVNLNTYILSISVIARAAGLRVIPYLNEIVPKLTSFSQIRSDQISTDTDVIDEHKIVLVEACLRALESIILCCPTKMTPYLQTLLNLAIDLSAYDPLYSYEEDVAMDTSTKANHTNDDDQWGNGGDDGWGADNENNGDADQHWGVSEDVAAATASTNDLSWKVRRAAITVLTAFSRARVELLRDFSDRMFEHFVARFKERDSAVKEDILLACRDLLHATLAWSHPVSGASETSMTDDDDMPSSVPTPLQRTNSNIKISNHMDSIISGLVRQFPTADVRSKVAIFAVLKEIATVQYGQLGSYFSMLVSPIVTAIDSNASSADVSLDALKVLDILLRSHTYEESSQYLPEFTHAIIITIRSGPSANLPAALSVSSTIAITTKGCPVAEIVNHLFVSVFAQLEQNDVSLDIKLASITSMASIIANHGDVLKQDLNRVWKLFADRLLNDSTCQQILYAIVKIANGPNQVDLRPICVHFSQILSFFRRKQSPRIQRNSIKCITSLLRSLEFKHHYGVITQDMKTQIINEAKAQIIDTDLSLTHCTLDLLSTLITVPCKTSAETVHILELTEKTALPHVLTLANSPLLQGVALSALLEFVKNYAIMITSTSIPNAYEKFITACYSGIDPNCSKQAYSTIALCIATAATSASEKEWSYVVNQSIQRIQQHDVRQMTAALLTLGELGRKTELKIPNIQSIFLSAFDNKTESVRSAAAIALGNIAVGSLADYLPKIVGLVQEKPEIRYLLFSSLKEILVALSTSPDKIHSFTPFKQPISQLLMQFADSPHDGTRSIVGECLGRLCVICPIDTFPVLESMIPHNKPEVRALTISALRSAFVSSIDKLLLAQRLPPFFSLIKDDDLEVRRQTVFTLQALLRMDAELLPREMMSKLVLPTLFIDTKPKPELIHIVDYGAFKESIDDGKPLRKSVFAVLDTFLAFAPHRLPLSEFISAVENGLMDTPDIQVAAYCILENLARNSIYNSALLEVLDNLPRLILATIKGHIAVAKTINPETGKPKSGGESGNTEAEHAVDCLQAALRAFTTFNKINGVEQCKPYLHFYKQVCATPLLVAMLQKMNLA